MTIKLANVKVTASIIEEKIDKLRQSVNSYDKNTLQNPQAKSIYTFQMTQLTTLYDVLDSMKGNHIDLRIL